MAERETLTRDAVVAAARDQIQTKGLDALSLRQVGAALGVTAPALYAYVKDKRDLLRGVAEGEFRRLLDRFAEVTETDPLERMRHLSTVYVGYAVENPELFKTMFVFPPELSLGEATGEELPMATQAFNYAIDAVREGMASGALADADPTIVTFVSWTATHGLANVLNLGFAFDDATRDLLVETTIDTILNGLRPR
ncbi:MAG: TetR/AcrR family transcriptional regulator [Acidimicrobiales bacterium]